MITLQFCGFNSLVAKVIAFGTEGIVGHVDAVLPDATLLGAQHAAGLGGKPAGVQIRPASYGDTCGMTNRIRVSIPATKDQTEAWLDFLLSQVGKPYDTQAILAFVAGRDWHDPKAWFCSELQAAALEGVGIILPLFSPANKVTPQELLLICSAIAPARQVSA